MASVSINPLTVEHCEQIVSDYKIIKANIESIKKKYAQVSVFTLTDGTKTYILIVLCVQYNLEFGIIWSYALPYDREDGTIPTVKISDSTNEVKSMSMREFIGLPDWDESFDRPYILSL